MDITAVIISRRLISSTAGEVFYDWKSSAELVPVPVFNIHGYTFSVVASESDITFWGRRGHEK